MLRFKEKGSSKLSTAVQHLGLRSIYFFFFHQMPSRAAQRWTGQPR